MIHVDPALVAPDLAATPDDAAAPARALIGRQLAVLSRLAEIGMEIAEAAGREAVAGARSASEGAALATGQWRDPSLAFHRVARAVRMTIALQSRLMKDVADLDRADEQAERSRTSKRRMRLARVVDDAVRATVAARRAAGHLLNEDELDEDAIEDEIERLTDETVERLTEAEDGFLDGRPFDEVVAAICKDLGLSADWTARLRCAVAPPHDAANEASGQASGVRLYPDLPAPPPDPAPCLSASTDEHETQPAAPLRTPP